VNFIVFSWLLTIHETAWYIISVVSVTLSVCQTKTITFERLDAVSSYLHIRYIYRDWEYGSSLYMKVIGSRSRSRCKKVENPYSRNIKLPSTITPL